MNRVIVNCTITTGMLVMLVVFLAGCDPAHNRQWIEERRKEKEAVLQAQIKVCRDAGLEPIIEMWPSGDVGYVNKCVPGTITQLNK